VLLEDYPGLAKTLAARSFAQALGLEFRRVQFTPDLMPADMLGTSLFDFQSGRFTLSRGPIFTELLLADEINRTPPKTQSALLEAMQERSVTLDGVSHRLGDAFFVIATQNPIEQEGTYPLPEAQLDRFLLKLRIGYPSRDDERRMASVHGRAVPDLDGFALEPLVGTEFLQQARAAVHAVRIEDPVRDYLVDVVRATRDHAALRCGASPRAVNMLAACARALAAVQGMDFVIPDHVQQLVVPLLAHRVVLTPAAEIEGQATTAIVEQIVQQIEAPR
jgi:MoxR-like ATPase